MNRKACVAAAAACLCLCGAASAAYLDNVTMKADRGLSNVLGCWLEVPYHTYARAREKGIAAGAPAGLCTGIVMLPCRLVSGILDIATLPVPCPRRGWEGLMEPQYNQWVEQPDRADARVQPAATLPAAEELPAAAPADRPGQAP